MLPALAMARCAPDPGGSGRPLCAYGDDYWAFVRAQTLAPLWWASAAYACYVLARIDFGAHRRTARLLTCSLVFALAWLAGGAVELALLGGAASTSTSAWRAALAHRLGWSPGAALLGMPACVAGGLGLALLVDVALGVRPVVALFRAAPAGHGAWRSVWRVAAALLVAAAPPLASLWAPASALGAQWLAGAAALVAAGAVVALRGGADMRADVRAAAPPLLAVWLLMARRYHVLVHLMLLVALLYGALATLALATTTAARAHRAAVGSRYGHLQKL